jgi:Phage tail tube protein
MSGSNAYTNQIGSTDLIAGVGSLTIDGEVYDLITGSYSSANIMVDSLYGLNGFQGLSGKPRVGFIAAQVRDAGNLSVATICAKRNSTVVLIMASGKTISGTGMWFAGEPSEVDVAEATLSVRFEGQNVNEVLVR